MKNTILAKLLVPVLFLARTVSAHSPLQPRDAEFWLMAVLDIIEYPTLLFAVILLVNAVFRFVRVRKDKKRRMVVVKKALFWISVAAAVIVTVEVVRDLLLRSF